MDVEVLDPPQGKAHLKIQWTRRATWQPWARLSEGGYLLRTNRRGYSAGELWKMYMPLVEAEAAFRTQKSELVLRPIWHQEQKRVQAHILIRFLAYVLRKTVEQWMRASGLGSAPRTLLDEVRGLKSMDVILPTDQGREVHLRCVSRPEEPLAILLYRLGIAPPARLQAPCWLPQTDLCPASAAPVM
ncbi:MAG: hypothetical protein NUV77_19725 [Thermoguttaceae bacterium]|nr:hypothetical protein [Thermoguttaceae bacterium]